MATDLAQFRAELVADLNRENLLSWGFREILAVEVSPSAKAEAQEALAWTTERANRLSAQIATLDHLTDHGYPGRVEQVAPFDAIREIQAAHEAFGKALAELHPPLTARVTVSEEMPA